MMSPQASSGAATTLPMSGTVLTTAPLIRQGAATTLQPETTMVQARTRSKDFKGDSIR
jgi:hypothetical protein